MDESAAIIDYAGPRKRSRLRMASQSDVSLSVTADRVVVAESLAGQGTAVAGIAFGLGVMAVTVALSAYDVRRGRLHNNAWNILIPMAVLAAAMAGLMLAIVQQTWRRTTLTAAHDDLRLSFTSPLHRRHYRWTGNDIADVVIALTANDGTAAPLGEVLITRVSGGDVRLFTDHLAERLWPIARSVHDALRHGRADVPAVPVAAAEPVPVPDDLLPRAERTAGRLVDLHRSLRDKP